MSPRNPLSYNGQVITDKGDMLSLTDMFNAAKAKNVENGGDPKDFENRKPSEWLRSADAKRFIEFLVDTLGNQVGISHLVKTSKGSTGKKGGETFAHWQIGMAYAKYLDPEFHMWCNTQVRAVMEGKANGAVSAETIEQIERSFGIMRQLIHKVTEIEKAMPMIAGQMAETMISAKLAERNLLLRHGVTAKRIWDDFHLPPRLRGATVWLGNRLAEMGCCVDGGLKADRGNSAVRLFDPDKARICMKNGLLNTALNYAAERQGQGKLNLKG